MGNALKNLLNNQSPAIDDDVLEACLKMTLPLEKEFSAQKSSPPSVKAEHSVISFLIGPFHNTY